MMDRSTLESLAAAYTAKKSTAATPEQFVTDYLKNLKLFEEEARKRENKWWLYE